MTLPHTAEKLISDTMTASDVMRAWMELVESRVEIYTASDAQFLDRASDINTLNKYQFKKVVNSDSYLVMVAIGDSDISAWQPSDGSPLVTPA